MIAFNTRLGGFVDLPFQHADRCFFPKTVTLSRKRNEVYNLNVITQQLYNFFPALRYTRVNNSQTLIERGD